MIALYLLSWCVLAALLAYLSTEFYRGIVETVTSIRAFVERLRYARDSAAREVARIESEANASVSLLQQAYWQAAQQLRDELDPDDE